MKKLQYFGVLVFSIGLLTAFQVVDTSDNFERPPFRRLYLEKMYSFHQAQQQKCREEAMTLARLQVDSVLTGKKLLVENDSFILLPRPIKPTKPDFDFDIDTSPIDPLFLRKDSL